LLRRRPFEPIDRAFIESVSNETNLEGGHPSAPHGVREAGGDECERRQRQCGVKYAPSHSARTIGDGSVVLELDPS
jgi:hypothetical protein